MAIDFESLRAEYADLWQRMQIRPERQNAVNAIASRLLALKPRYEQVATRIGMSWAIIALLHQREADCNFACVLHNGEKIVGTGRRTTLVPSGRGPFSTWEESAFDALTMPPHSMQRIGNWTIERACYEMEKFNGFGYRSRHIPTPYLWSYTNNYQSGKFIADGVFSAGVADKQCGTMPILKRLMELDTSIRFDGSPAVVVPQGSVVAGLQIGAVGDAVRNLQNALTALGFSVGEIDGEFGPNTAAGVRAFQVAHGLPATGIADLTTMQTLAAAARPKPAQPVAPADILLALMNALKQSAPAPGGSAGTQAGSSADMLQVIIGALLGRKPDAAAPAAGPVLSPIDKALGGEALAGKKTALSVFAYVVLALLKAAGVVGAATPGGQIATILIAAFGALGGVAKVDRAIQAIGVIAAKPK
jgi:lysozyme family protein/peptidoglycan hydrolase-like protein with peptidoglycan-binding domain